MSSAWSATKRLSRAFSSSSSFSLLASLIFSPLFSLSPRIRIICSKLCLLFISLYEFYRRTHILGCPVFGGRISENMPPFSRPKTRPTRGSSPLHAPYATQSPAIPFQHNSTLLGAPENHPVLLQTAELGLEVHRVTFDVFSGQKLSPLRCQPVCRTMQTAASGCLGAVSPPSCAGSP